MLFSNRLEASFRGVSFLFETSSGESGRRAIPHAYPKKEVGFAEDNGKVLQSETIEARLVGRDYFIQFQALLDALNQPGPGELIHPYFGVRQVQVGQVNHKLENKVERTATISFDVYEVGENLFPNLSINTAGKILTLIEQVRSAVYDAFDLYFTIKSIDSIDDVARLLLSDLEEFARGLPSEAGALFDWFEDLTGVSDNLSSLLLEPLQFAEETAGLILGLSSVVIDPLRSISAFDQMEYRWQDSNRALRTATGGSTRNIKSVDGVATSVSVVKKQADIEVLERNTLIIQRFVLDMITISKAYAFAVADMPEVDTSSESVEVIASLSGAERPMRLSTKALKQMNQSIAASLADAAERAVERGDSELWRTLRQLRQAVVKDGRARLDKLAQSQIITPSLTMPVAAIAYQITGDANARQSIVWRNGLSNPASVMPSQSVEVVNGK